MADKSRDIPVRQDETRATAPAPRGTGHPLASLRTEMDKLFDNFVGGWGAWPGLSRGLQDLEPFRRFEIPLSLPRFDLSPSVDVEETDVGWEITAELPGLDEKDIKVTLRDDVLTLEGEKKAERKEKKENMTLSERSYGSFRRSFRLPDGAEVDKMKASFAKGVMTITVPRAPEAKAKAKERRIKVTAG